MGDLRGAAQAVDEAERVMSEPGQPGLDRGQSGSGAVAGPRRRAIRRPRAVRLDLASPGTATCRAGGLATHGRGRADLAALARRRALPARAGRAAEPVLEPPAVRLSELQGLHAAATRADIDPRLAEAFVDAAVSGWRDAGRVSSPEPAEQALLGLIAAEALRLAGRGQEARALLDDAVALRPDDLLWWRWLQAQERIGPARQVARPLLRSLSSPPLIPYSGPLT